MEQDVRPAGTVTFLFTDIEGSTVLWDEYPDAMGAALATHDQICRSAIADSNGWVFSTGGDGFAAAFARSTEALTAAIKVQLELDAASWPGSVVLKVRMGLHTGEAQERDGNYFGPPVNQAARIMSAGHGGQILLSAVTAELVGLMPGIELLELGTHRLRGIVEPATVFGVAAPGLEWVDRPLATDQVAVGNIPTALDGFVGRNDEIRHLGDALRVRNLLTLTGVGGVGKTRLAIEIAGSAADDFPDGIWLVELAPVDDPAAVVQAVATTLDVHTQAGMTPLDSILDVMRSQRVLLILDNTEHVRGAAAELVAAVLESCQRACVLVTSREPLGIRAERVHSVASLDPTEGFELFCERAGAVDDTYTVDKEDRIAIESICRRLDGIPLAIELAAARTRSLTPSDVLARLDDRFRLLRGGRSGVDRHQTLQTALSWSYQLLTAPEQTLFDRLSVFAGSFALAEAEQICGFGTLDESDVLDLVGSLVDKSMVVADRRGRTVRYHLLETIRQYGAAKLTDRVESAEINDRHLVRYLSVASDIATLHGGPQQLVALARLDQEFDNFRAAFEWAWTRSDVNSAADMAITVFWVAQLRFEVAEWIDLVRSALPAEHPLEDLLEWSAVWSGVLAGDSRRGLDYSASLLDRSDVPAGLLANTWSMLATAHLNIGDAETGLAEVRRGMAVAVEHDLPQQTLAFVGCWCAWGCEPEAVAGYAGIYRTSAELTGAPLELAAASFFGGVADLVDGRVDQARDHFVESLRLAQGTNGMIEGQALQGLAAAAAASGNPAEAAAAFTQSLTHLYRARFWMYLWIVVENLAVYWTDNGDIEGGAVLLGHLQAHQHAHGVFATGRRRSLALMTSETRWVELMQVGADMTRDEAVDYAISRLAPVNTASLT